MPFVFAVAGRNSFVTIVATVTLESVPLQDHTMPLSPGLLLTEEISPLCLSTLHCSSPYKTLEEVLR